MRVLVSPASTHGATAEIGRAIAATLRRYGLDVDVAQPEHLHDLRPYSGFVLGSALYRGKWKDEALELIENHAELIGSLPCWLFSSGPIADDEPVEPLLANEEERLLSMTRAREHRVFGGRLDLDRLSAAERWLARWVKLASGDARSWKEIDRWATTIAAELTAGHPLSTPPLRSRIPTVLRSRRTTNPPPSEEDVMIQPTASKAPCLAGEFRPVSEIAVPVRGLDRYDRSLAVAARLAERWEVPVRVLHVRLPDDPVDSDRLEAVRSAFHAQHPQIPIESTLVAGEDVATAVESIVEPTALVLMSSDHADREATPSAAERILRKVGVAMIVGPDADSEHVFGPITVALDGSPTAERAVDVAVAFARSMDRPLELVQVVDASTVAHVGRLRAAGERVAESGYVQSVAERLEAEEMQVGWEVVHDEDPVAGVLTAVKRRGGGPVVLGSHGDSLLGRRMLGSTAMGLVADSNYPVLVVSTTDGGEPELTA